MTQGGTLRSPWEGEVEEISWVDLGANGNGNRMVQVVGKLEGESSERDDWKGEGCSGSGRNLAQGKLPGIYKGDFS